MIIPEAALLELVGRYLERQSWYVQVTAREEGPLEYAAIEPLVEDGQPGLVRLLLSKGRRRLQLFVGFRRSTALVGALRNEDAALLGAVEVEGTSYVLYDALADDECCRELLAIATDGAEEALRVRHVATLVSHASLVFDERLFMKVYRVLEGGERPEAEVLFGLDSIGFNAIIAPVARWRKGDYDLALVREFLPSALEGRQLALTSLRDLLARVTERDEDQRFAGVDGVLDPDLAAQSAGGDIAFEFVRLGQTTARLHLALAEAFPTAPIDDDSLGVPVPEGAGGLGRAIRLHGDYHLRRVMRSDGGWLVTGFGDDPLYSAGPEHPSIAAETGSPLEDLADMFFSISRVALDARALRPRAEQDLALPLAEAWTRRNQEALLRGYSEVIEVKELLPEDDGFTTAVLGALVERRVDRYEATFASG